MNEVKEYNLSNRIVYLLTYADNNAIGYFEKQGFIDNFNLHKSVYQDYIQMYDESLLMACRIRNDGKVWAKPKTLVDKTSDNPGENQEQQPHVDKPKYKWVRCERCQIELYSFQDQITHMEQEHDRKGGTAGPYAFKCLKCLGSFSSANLWKHKNGHKFENQDPKDAAGPTSEDARSSETVVPSQVQEVGSTVDHKQGEQQPDGEHDQPEEHDQQEEHDQPEEHDQQDEEQGQQQEQVVQVEIVTMPSSNEEQGNVQDEVDKSGSDKDDTEVNEEGPLKQNFSIEWAITCVDCNKLPCSCEMILPG